MYIILEVLIIENFIINLLILYLAKIMSRNEGSYKRMIFGAFLASLYSLAIFSPLRVFLLSFLGKFIISIFIIRISFSYINLKKFMKTLTAFYITSFIFAGASLGSFLTSIGLDSLANINLGFGSFPVIYLILGIGISFLGARIIFAYFKTSVIKENYMADVSIYYKNKVVVIQALLDTGNSLVDPFSRKKVMVVDYNALEDILPKGVEELIEANNRGDYLKIEKHLDLLKDDFKPRIIPFKSVGKDSTLIGFVPDLIKIHFMDNEKVSSDVIIALYSGSLKNDMGYSGLINFDMNWGDFGEIDEVQT